MLQKIKLSLICTLAFFSSGRIAAQDGIHVTVNNLQNNKGYVLISLFRECQGYPDKPEKAFQKARVAISNKSAAVFFPGLPAGNYSVAMLHDENDDKKMNTNFFGIPKEGYGFSNNVMGTFGPPSCSRAGFRHTAISVTPITIRARYGW